MKIALAQLNYHIGNFELNTEKIIQSIKKAELDQVDLIVFAELAVCGYPPLDFLNYDHFIHRCISSMEHIATFCKTTSAIIGGPAINPDPKGKNLFNAAFVLSEGKIKHVVSKTLLPTYDVFDEYRWFESNREFNCIEINGVRIALTVCEDLWNMGDDPLYTFWPMEELIQQQPVLMINIAASPFNHSHIDDRKNILEKNVRQYKLPLIYVNQVGAQTDILFDGGSLIYDGQANLLKELNYFKEDYSICEFNSSTNKIQTTPTIGIQKSNDLKSHRIYQALTMGISDYFSKMGFKKAILGLSGGIDSALVLVLAAEALGKENIHAVLMPSEYSSDHSISDSLQLVKNLGCTHEILPITPMYNAFIQSLKHDFEGLPFNVAEENIQARVRGTTLMAISNKLGYILLNTSNKSELSAGYGTLYGDMCGGISVIGDLYKTEIFALCNFINASHEIIPPNIITKPPSAELRPGQLDSDSLPPYDILDSILYNYIELEQGPDQIIKLGFDSQLVNKILKMVNINEWKRFQFAPILRVSPKAFGRGRRMPLVAKYLG